MNQWTENLDSKIVTKVAHVDYARAFDSVSLPKLIYKLEKAGIAENLLSCIISMLSGRSQRRAGFRHVQHVQLHRGAHQSGAPTTNQRKNL